MKTIAIITLLVLSSSMYAQRVSTDEPKSIYLFDGMSYEEYSLKRTREAVVSATSTAPSKSNRYIVTNVTDDDQTTAWVEGKKDEGIGERIRFSFDEGVYAPDVIMIIPGYLKTEQTWMENCRASEIKIWLMKGPDAPPEERIIEEITVPLLVNQDGIVNIEPQYIEIGGLALQNMAYDEFHRIEIEITKVDSQGTKYKDTCISEVAFYSKDKLLKRISAEEYNKLNKDN